MSTVIYAPAHALFARMLRRTIRSETGCWIYQGCTNSRGYSQVNSGKKAKNITGHRLAVMARDGFIADGMVVDHECHNSAHCTDGNQCQHRRCVNPSHLAVVTNAVNVSRRRLDRAAAAA